MVLQTHAQQRHTGGVAHRWRHTRLPRPCLGVGYTRLPRLSRASACVVQLPECGLDGLRLLLQPVLAALARRPRCGLNAPAEALSRIGLHAPAEARSWLRVRGLVAWVWADGLHLQPARVRWPVGLGVG